MNFDRFSQFRNQFLDALPEDPEEDRSDETVDHIGDDYEPERKERKNEN